MGRPEPIRNRFTESISDIHVKNLWLITVAGIINAFGITVFLYPVKLYDSGISGTSMLLAQITPAHLSLSFFLIILNLPLFAYGARKEGPLFTIYSIYAVLIYSLFSYLITDVFPVDVSFASPLAGQDLLLCALFGGVISGVGSGLVLRSGGAIDGIEVLAVIFARRLGISVGTFVMIYNVCLYIVAGILGDSWILPLYSIVTYAAGVKTVDFLVEGIDREKSAMIITEHEQEVAEALMDFFESGSTILPAKGGYSNSKKGIVYFVVNRFQVTRLKNIVHSIDPYAYVIISDVAEVFSQNME